MTDTTTTGTAPEPGYEWEAELLAMPPVPISAEPDVVDEVDDDLHVLDGLTLDYTYSSGRHYRLIFRDDHTVTFEMPDLHMDIPDFEPLGMPYRVRVIRPDVMIVHWLVKKGAIHVSLVIDLEDSKLHVSAMMPPNRWEFFDTATISSAVRA